MVSDRNVTSVGEPRLCARDLHMLILNEYVDDHMGIVRVT